MRPSRNAAVATLLVCLVVGPALAQSTVDADALEKRATALFTAGKTAEAIAALEQLRAMRRAAGDRALEARALWRLGMGYRGAGRNADAVRVSQEALRLAIAANAESAAAEALNQLYQLTAFPPEFPDAARTLDEALRLARRSNQAATIARVLDSQARWHGANGRLDTAIASIDEGLTHAAAAGEEPLVAGLFAIRSTMGSRAGRLGEALSDALRARETAAKVGPRAEVTALFVLAQSHSHLSNFDEAVRLWTEVIDRYRAIGPPIGVALALDSRCHVLHELGQFEAAIADVREAIAIHATLKSRPSAALFARAALANIRLGRDTEGRRWLADAEARLSEGPDFEQIQTLTLIGVANVMLGDAAGANRIYQRLLEMGRRRNSLEDEWLGQFGLGRAALVTRDPETAIGHLERAVSIIEQLRASVPAQELRAAYLSRRVEAHEWLTAALMMQSSSPADRYVEQAFNVAERARVRALADLLAEGRAKRRANQPVAAPRARTRQEIAANLGPRDLLIEYLIGADHAYAWAVTRDSFVGFELPSPAELDDSVRRALGRIDADDREQLQLMADDLTPVLLGPAMSKLDSIDRIIFVPDGPLQRLPFAALPLPGGRYLAQRVAISTVGSGSLLEMLKPDARARGVLALAASGAPAQPGLALRSAEAPLREAAGEIHDAIRLLAPQDGGRAIADATELGVKSRGFAPYRVIHVAAHSLIDESFPHNSAILLRSEGAEDGALRAAEISQLPVSADLVVLAACRTQFGRIMRGEGLLSLARSFMEAGARSVVASLWDVGDRDTRVLMRGFYAGIAAGLPPDQALRMSQLQMIRAGGSLAAPKVWAAFQVAGEARQPVWEPRTPSASAIALTLALIAGIVVLWRR
jgi:CHAT domain-containing protein